MKPRELKSWLAAQGCTFEQGKGSHLKVRYQDKRSVLPMHQGRDMKRGTWEGILKHLGLFEVYKNTS